MIEFILLVVVGLVPAIVLHEYAHGWVANRLGDPTARLSGRLTVNPIKHVDLFGSILFPAILFLVHSPVMLGWAKPVPVNFSRLNNPKRDMMLVAVAGPIVNIILAFALAQLMRLGIFEQWHGVLRSVFELNLVLAIFNMVPIPPLDGSRIVLGFLPNSLARAYASLEPFGIVIVLVMLQLGLLSFIYPVIDFLAALLGVRL